MILEPIAIKDIVAASSPMIKMIVDTLVVPKLEQLKKRVSLDYNKYLIPTGEHFSEYFHRSYKKYSIINTLVFNNSQQLLKEIYIPLTIKNFSNNNISKIEIFPSKLISEYNNLLIIDTAGMGKSTLMKKFFLDIIDNGFAIPILIELRRISKQKNILMEIHEQLNSMIKDFNVDLLYEFINEGNFIFILDGYDEISFSEREAVTKDIQNFVSKANNNSFILTSRPESALTSFGNFQKFTIEPLKKKEAFELLRKYDKQGDISKLLIKKLENPEYQNIDEFLKNPLLVSLLFLAFEHKQTIPLKKHIFYRQVYDANFETHDLTKGDSYMHEKYSGLDIEDFHSVLRHIGYACLKEQKIEFSKDEVLSLITKAKQFCVGLSFTESGFLNDILKTVPLFTQDGNYYKWAHKSLQEYFAAQFIYKDSKGQQDKILSKMYNSSSIEKYVNLLDMYYDIDYKTFRHVIVKMLLVDFKKYCDENIFKDISDDLLRERLSLTYNNSITIIKRTKKHEFLKESTDKIDDMINNIIRQHQLKFKYNLYNIEIFQLDDFILIKSFESKYLLTILLFRKKCNFVYSYSVHEKIEENKIDISILEDEKPYDINFGYDNILNSLYNFSKINNILKNYRHHNYIINYNNAIKELSIIDEEIKSECEENYLTDGI